MCAPNMSSYKADYMLLDSPQIPYVWYCNMFSTS